MLAQAREFASKVIDGKDDITRIPRKKLEQWTNKVSQIHFLLSSHGLKIVSTDKRGTVFTNSGSDNPAVPGSI